MGQYEECVKDCDAAVERGREVRTVACKPCNPQTLRMK